MKKLTCLLTILILTSGSLKAGEGSSSGAAGIFGTATVLRTGGFVLGVEPVFYLKGTESFGFLGHVKYGLVPRFELAAQVGVNRGKNYFAGGIEYGILPDTKQGLGLSFRALGFGNGNIGSGLDLNINLSNRFSRVTLYGAFEYKYFTDENVDALIYLVPGIRIPVNRNMSFIGEFGLNMNSGGNASYVSGGLSFAL